MSTLSPRNQKFEDFKSFTYDDPPTLLCRTNMFHMNEGGCALVLQKDLEYWIIGNQEGSIFSDDDVSHVFTPHLNLFEGR